MVSVRGERGEEYVCRAVVSRDVVDLTLAFERRGISRISNRFKLLNRKRDQEIYKKRER